MIAFLYPLRAMLSAPAGALSWRCDLSMHRLLCGFLGLRSRGVFLKGTAMRSVLCRLVPGLGFLLIFILSIPVEGAAGEIAQMGGGGPPPPEKMMRRMDENGDGKISRQEFLGPPNRFDMIDADKDGFLTVEEITTFRAKRQNDGGMGGQSPAKGPNGEAFLTAAQLRLLITGTEISHTSPRSGNAVLMKFLADGTVDGTVGLGRRKQGAVIPPATAIFAGFGSQIFR